MTDFFQENPIDLMVNTYVFTYVFRFSEFPSGSHDGFESVASLSRLVWAAAGCWNLRKIGECGYPNLDGFFLMEVHLNT